VGSAAEQLAVRVKAAADAADELAACVKPAAAAAEQLVARVKAAEVAADQHLLPPRSLAQRTPNERDDDLLAVAAATPAVPPVAPRSMQPAHRRASGRLPVVPLAALQAPSPGRSDPTPSPVPRVSLVPPTGRHDHPRQALHAALGARNQPTVAARRHGDGAPAPAHTVPPLGGLPRRGFLERLAKDLRSSKREVVLGLGIGLGLSFMLVRWGQEYLTQRVAPEPGPEFRVESLAVNPARLPAVHLPVASAPAGSALPVPGTPPSVLSSAGSPPAVSAPSGKEAARKETATLTQAALAGGQQLVPHRSSASHSSRSARPAPSARPRAGSDPNLDAEDGVLQAPSDELEPRDKTPLSPSQSAGLGLDLPL